MLNYNTAFMGALSLAVLSDYYLWELEERSSSILEASLPSNLQYLAGIYTSQSSLQYSFWLLIGGMCVDLHSNNSMPAFLFNSGSLFSLFPFLLSWRLLVLLPGETSAIGIENSASAIEMSEHSQANFDPSAPAYVFY